MGYRLNFLDEPVFMAVSKPMQTEFGIHHRLESCATYHFGDYTFCLKILTIFLLFKSNKFVIEPTCLHPPNEGCFNNSLVVAQARVDKEEGLLNIDSSVRCDLRPSSGEN